MKKVIFVTGSDRKIRHMREACESFGITVDQQTFDVDEIQSHDPIKISEHKIAEAFARTSGQPTVINDAFWNIPALNGFPGGYMKDVIEWFEAQDWLDLMANKTDRRICCTETLIYKDAHQTKMFTKDYWFEIITGPPRGEGLSMEQVVSTDGGKLTIAEEHDSPESSYTVKKYVWHDFAVWFSTQE